MYKAKNLIKSKPLLHIIVKKSKTLKKRFLEPIQRKLIQLA